MADLIAYHPDIHPNLVCAALTTRQRFVDHPETYDGSTPFVRFCNGACGCIIAWLEHDLKCKLWWKMDRPAIYETSAYAIKGMFDESAIYPRTAVYWAITRIDRFLATNT